MSEVEDGELAERISRQPGIDAGENIRLYCESESIHLSIQQSTHQSTHPPKSCTIITTTPPLQPSSPLCFPPLFSPPNYTNPLQPHPNPTQPIPSHPTPHQPQPIPTQLTPFKTTSKRPNNPLPRAQPRYAPGPDVENATNCWPLAVYARVAVVKAGCWGGDWIGG